MKVKLYWFPIITGRQNFTLSGLTLLVHNIDSEIVFVVCPLRTIYTEGWKHGYRDTGLNMACTQ